MIANDCNLNRNSTCCIGKTYQNHNLKYIAGNFNFKVIDYEAYQLLNWKYNLIFIEKYNKYIN